MSDNAMPSSETSSNPSSPGKPHGSTPWGSSGEKPRISVLIASRNRPIEVRKCIESVNAQDFDSLEIVVLDDGSDTPLEVEIGSLAGRISVLWLRNEAPTGVSGARNKLVENARGEILVFLDDDAWLINTNELATISERFESDTELGILAFLIHLNSVDSGELQVPFNKATLRRDSSITTRKQQASYFVGAGHAISKHVFEECGLYPVEFIYGHEELDLSYRAVNHGFSIMYDPSISIVHDPASSQIAGEGKKRFESYYVTRNRIWLAHRNLPWRYAITYSIAWSGYYFIKSLRNRQLINWFLAIKDGLFGIDKSKRQPLSKEAVKYISSHHGRLWR